MIDTNTQSGLIGALHVRLRSLAAIGACGVMALAGISHAGGSVTMTFEDFLPPGGVLELPVTPYTEVGFTLDSSDSGGTSDGIFEAGTFFNDNGTDIFGWCGGPCFNDPILPIVLTLERTDSMPFAFLSFDASGLFGGDDPGLIDVVGNLVGGGTVSQTIDPTPNVWTTFPLTGFNNVESVEISLVSSPDAGPAMDNLVMSPPPPEVSCFADPVSDDDDCALAVSWEVIFSPDCEGTVEAVIDIGCDLIPVENGQIVDLECEDDDDCEFEFDDDDDVLEIESSIAVLVVVATDIDGNETICELDLCAACPLDDDDDG